jgi:AraC family transcriptional regulator
MDTVTACASATESSSEKGPVLATLIASAVATFDVDRDASRRYLMRASSILRAFATHEFSVAHAARARGGLTQWQLNRVINYIEQHLAEKITAETLAAHVNLSVGQLFKTFKSTVGISPLQYVASRRVEFACLLMQTTSHSVSQIAADSGFCDQSHLGRVFRRVLGVSPAAWRRHGINSPCFEPR